MMKFGESRRFHKVYFSSMEVQFLFIRAISSFLELIGIDSAYTYGKSDIDRYQ